MNNNKMNNNKMNNNKMNNRNTYRIQKQRNTLNISTINRNTLNRNTLNISTINRNTLNRNTLNKNTLNKNTPIKTTRKEYMQIKLYNDIFNNYSTVNLDNIIKKVCVRFYDDKCQDIFNEFIINMFYTFTLLIKNADLNLINNFKKKSKYTKDTAILPINLKKDSENIKMFLYLMQDHSFGEFKGANLAYLTYEIAFIN